MMLNRRRFLIGALAMPAIVPVTSLMPLRGIILPVDLTPRSWRHMEITDDAGNVLGGIDDFIWRKTGPSKWSTPALSVPIKHEGLATHVQFGFDGSTMRVKLDGSGFKCYREQDVVIDVFDFRI